MRRLYITLLALLPLGAAAQILNPADYIFPVLNVTGYYSSNFGEMRPNHFHSGVDIKTDGVEGRPVVAVADGYVSRLMLSPGGFGRALYITHTNGTTSVYGHLARFNDALEKYLQEQRLRQKKNTLNLYFTSTQFPVRQGDRVANAGNSGSSFGPHLHFELRDTPSQRTLNTIRQGVIRTKDNLPPRLVRLYYIALDTLQGIPMHATPQPYDLTRVDAHTYKVVRQAPIPVGKQGYFLIEATDRKNDVNNTFGIYRIAAQVDGELFFEYRMDGFTFDLTRYSNTVAYYPLQVTSRNEVISMALAQGGCQSLYTVIKSRGVITTTRGMTRKIELEAEDDCGNKSQLSFTIQGDGSLFRAQADTLATRVLCMQDQRLSYNGGELWVELPAGALYESCFARPGISPLEATSSTPRLSPIYHILDNPTPLHLPAKVSIRTTIPTHLQPHVTLASYNHKGRLSYLGGSYTEGLITTSTRTLCDVTVVADTVPPTIRPYFTTGANLTSKQRLSFNIGDNFSGINACDLYIDGEWAICDRYPMKGAVIHTFNTPATKSDHTIRLVVSDNCGNTQIWQGTFYR